MERQEGSTDSVDITHQRATRRGTKNKHSSGERPDVSRYWQQNKEASGGNQSSYPSCEVMVEAARDRMAVRLN